MKNRRRMHPIDWGAIVSGAVVLSVGIAFRDEQARMIGLALLMAGAPRIGELARWKRRQP